MSLVSYSPGGNSRFLDNFRERNATFKLRALIEAQNKQNVDSPLAFHAISFEYRALQRVIRLTELRELSDDNTTCELDYPSPVYLI